MTVINRSMYPMQQGFSSIKNMHARLDQLQVQLGTGKKFATLADYGNQRPLSLQVRERLSRIEGFTQNAGTVNLRLDMLDTVITRIEKIETDARASAIVGGYGADNLNLTNVPDYEQGPARRAGDPPQQPGRGPLSLRRLGHGRAAGRQCRCADQRRDRQGRVQAGRQ